VNAVKLYWAIGCVKTERNIGYYFHMNMRRLH